ncbi:hypothetical protein MLD38_036645 [Melastoma candidum]|uniref:Uncharacterized protein n=1 Tax=Melastoma candidum TaxID=119954 RepID=A0ACB9LL14_9MYRT|nr:hypothetical protein MLD38_036645 [Melastoma candidum]
MFIPLQPQSDDEEVDAAKRGRKGKRGLQPAEIFPEALQLLGAILRVSSSFAWLKCEDKHGTSSSDLAGRYFGALTHSDGGVPDTSPTSENKSAFLGRWPRFAARLSDTSLGARIAFLTINYSKRKQLRPMVPAYLIEQYLIEHFGQRNPRRGTEVTELAAGSIILLTGPCFGIGSRRCAFGSYLKEGKFHQARKGNSWSIGLSFSRGLISSWELRDPGPFWYPERNVLQVYKRAGSCKFDTSWCKGVCMLYKDGAMQIWRSL